MDGSALWSNFKTFLSHPYKGEEMNAFDWFLFLGLLIVLMVMWRIIFKHVEDGE